MDLGGWYSLWWLAGTVKHTVICIYIAKQEGGKCMFTTMFPPYLNNQWVNWGQVNSFGDWYMMPINGYIVPDKGGDIMDWHLVALSNYKYCYTIFGTTPMHELEMEACDIPDPNF